jgi:hypothetical protein
MWLLTKLLTRLPGKTPRRGLTSVCRQTLGEG